MKLLLDTHIFLWLISADKRLSDKALQAIVNTDNQVFLSAVSVWEIIVKYKLNKLDIPSPPHQYITSQRTLHEISSLPLYEEDVANILFLPPIHRDPFDRMLICQTMSHNLMLVTDDKNILEYEVPIFS